MRRLFERSGVLFLVGGVVNTAFSYGIYLLLNLFFGYHFAYFIAYVLGIAFSYWLNAKFVFRVVLSWRGFFAYPLVYVVQYAASAALLAGLVEHRVIGESLAPLLVTALTVPLTYLLSRYVLRRTSGSSSATAGRGRP